MSGKKFAAKDADHSRGFRFYRRAQKSRPDKSKDGFSVFCWKICAAWQNSAANIFIVTVEPQNSSSPAARTQVELEVQIDIVYVEP